MKQSNKEQIDNNCIGCAYGAQHYVNVNGKFLTTNCMHCINSDIPWQARKKRETNQIQCEHWQPKIIQIKQRRESIEYYLNYTANKLNEIAQILKEDIKKDK